MYARDQPPAGEPVYRGLGTSLPLLQVHVGRGGRQHPTISSNAQEFETFPLPGLVYRTIGKESNICVQIQTQKNHCDLAGGLLDILVILGPTPEDVAKQVSAALGRC